MARLLCFVVAVMFVESMRCAPSAAPPPLQAQLAAQVSDMRARFDELVDSAGAQLRAAWESPEHRSMQKVVHDNMRVMLDNVISLSGQLDPKTGKAAKEVQKILEDASQKLTKTAQEMRAKIPEIDSNAMKQGDQIKTGLKTASAETERVLKAMIEAAPMPANEDLATSIKKTQEVFTKVAEDIKTKIQEAMPKKSA